MGWANCILRRSLARLMQKHAANAASTLPTCAFEWLGTQPSLVAIATSNPRIDRCMQEASKVRRQLSPAGLQSTEYISSSRKALILPRMSSVSAKPRLSSVSAGLCLPPDIQESKLSLQGSPMSVSCQLAHVVRFTSAQLHLSSLHRQH